MFPFTSLRIDTSSLYIGPSSRQSCYLEALTASESCIRWSLKLLTLECLRSPLCRIHGR